MGVALNIEPEIKTSRRLSAGAFTRYEYDLLGRRSTETSNDRGITSYQYDLANNLISQTDARNITTTYQYDELERPTAKTFPDTTENVSLGGSGKRMKCLNTNTMMNSKRKLSGK